MPLSTHLCLFVFPLSFFEYIYLYFTEVVKSPDLRTWVYYDALNQGGEALPNTVAMDGSGDVSGTFTGSRYMTYDASQQKMRVDVELPGEQNSDQPEIIQDYLEHAMADCVSNGFTSLMVVFSSHGVSTIYTIYSSSHYCCSFLWNQLTIPKSNRAALQDLEETKTSVVEEN